MAATPTAMEPGAVSMRVAKRPVTAQHVHSFVEGCTCGAGIIGCCPCAFAVTAHGGVHSVQAGFSRFGPPPPAPGWRQGVVPAATGVLGAAGAAFGIRAFWLNGQAARRVAESLQGVRAQLIDTDALLGAQRAHGECVDGPWPAVVAYRERLVRLERRLARSARERTFERWIPGALQATASTGVLASLLPHSLLGAFHPMISTATTWLWASFGAAYAVRAAVDGVSALRDARALHRLESPAAHADRRDWQHARARAASDARLTGMLRLAESLSWTLFAVGSAAVAASPPVLLGISLAAMIGPSLPQMVVAAGVTATLLSAYLRRPTHTMTLPLLREMPMDPHGLAFGQLEVRTLRKQQQALAAYVAQARQAPGPAATTLGIRMAWQAAVLPSCGPSAYRAVADRAVSAARDEPLGEQAMAVAVHKYLVAEKKLLDAWRPSDALPHHAWAPQGSVPEDIAGRLQRAAESLAATESGRAALIAQRAELLGELAEQWKARTRQRPAADEGANKQERMMRGDDLRLATLLACGLLGEALAARQRDTPQKVVTLPQLSPLPHLHLEPVAEQWPALAKTLQPTIRHTFVRLFCNPHRLDEALAVVSQELAAIARHKTQAPPPARRAPACSAC